VGESNSHRESRSVERLINFSDGVVAVAITLLALPLVDIGLSASDSSVWQMLNANSGQVITFLFTFYVVVAMWAVHNRILNALAHFDVPILWLNTTWLALIVLLPWFSSLYGSMAAGDDTGSGSQGVGMLYWSAMAAVAMVGSAIGWRLARRPDLCFDGETPAADLRSRLRGPVLAAYFLLIGVVSLFLPHIANWMPFGIIPLSIVLKSRQTSDDADGDSDR
jgi:uncharacterized membrane protein